MVTATPTDGKYRTAMEAAEMNGSQAGKIFVITGPYSGIGVETTKALLHMGGSVVVGGRNPTLQEDFVNQLEEDYGKEKVDGHLIDLGDLQSVQEFANYVKGKYDKIDVLILNAGVMNSRLGETKDGFETQFGVNVVGHFLLAKLLADRTKRQVWVSSSAHMRDGAPPFDVEGYRCKKYNKEEHYDGWAQYQQSKLANIMLAKEFEKRYPDMEAVSLHPGVINTNLGRHIPWYQLPGLLFSILWRGLNFKTVEAGAATTVTCATQQTVENGGYYSDCDLAKEADSAKVEEDNAALFDFCDELTKDFQ